MKKISIIILLFISFLLVGCDWLTTTTTSSTTTTSTTTITTNTTTTTSSVTTASTTNSTTNITTTQTTTTQATTSATTTTATTTTATTTIVTTIDPNVVNLNLMISVLEDYDFLEHNGFDYSSLQKMGDDLVNSDYIEQRIDRSDSIKIYTDYVISRLLEFDPDSNFDEVNEVYFFYNDQIGQYNQSDQLNWMPMSLEEYMDFSLPTINLDFIYFEDFQFIYDGNQLILMASILDSEIGNLLGIEATGLMNCEISISIDLTDNSLEQIDIYYESLYTNTTILFVPYDDDAQVIIPNQ